MEYYLKRPITSGLIRSPFRTDKNPTCGFYYSKKNRLYLHDFGTGEHFDVFEIVRRKYGLTFPKAIDKILEDKDKFGINRSYIDTNVELEYIIGPNNFEYFKSFGITEKTLEFFNVSNVRAVYINESLSWRATNKNPIFLYLFPNGNFKLYRPLSSDKHKKWKSKCDIKDVQGYYQLPKQGRIVIITSSLKDAMVLYELGFSAIAFSSEAIPTKGENAKFIRSMIQHLESRFEKVILFLDNDEPGKEYSKKISESYSIDHMLIPDGNPKDISDYYKKHGRRKTRRLITKLIKNVYTSMAKKANLWTDHVLRTSGNGCSNINDNIS